MIALDASAVVEWLLGTPAGRALDPFVRDAGQTLHAPHLIDVEVASTFRRLAREGALSPERAHTSLELFAALDLERYAHADLLPRIWALRENLSAYDAAYVALAEALEAPLVTADARMAGASGHRAEITLLVG